MKKHSYSKSCFLLLSNLILFLIFGCNVDEIPPELASGLRGWFIMDENNKGVNISWYEVEDEDFDKYIVYRALNGMQPVEIGETENNFFLDTEVQWLEAYEYYIQSVDEIGNKSDLSDRFKSRNNNSTTIRQIRFSR